MRNITSAIVLTLASGLLTQVTHAACSPTSPFSEMVVFGDSLSDTNNLYTILKATNPSHPLMPLLTMTGGRITNGPMATEVVGSLFGCTLSPSQHMVGPVQGNNFAIIGAKTTDADNNAATPDIHLPTQINAYLASTGGKADAKALYVLGIGGNDIRAARDTLLQGVDSKSAKKAAEVAAKQVAVQLKVLVKAGAKNIILYNAPDVGAIPETGIMVTSSQIPDLAKLATNISESYNKKFTSTTTEFLAKTDVKYSQFDLYSHYKNLQSYAASQGVNTTDGCFSYTFGPNYKCAIARGESFTDTNFVYFDDVHPMKEVHQSGGVAMATKAKLDLFK